MTSQPVIARSDATKQSRAAAHPAIIVHSLAHAVAALGAAAEAGRAVVLASAPEAGIQAGPGWWRELVAAAREAVPAARFTALLDCGDDAGAAQGAMRGGVEGVIFTGHAEIADRLADIASRRGCRLVTRRPAPALDLATEFFAPSDRLRRRCAEYLSA